MPTLTGLTRIHDEGGVLSGGTLDEAVAMDLDQTGVPDLRLDDHNADGAVGNVGVVFQDADQVLAHLMRDEGDSCEEQKKCIMRKKIWLCRPP